MVGCSSTQPEHLESHVGRVKVEARQATHVGARHDLPQASSLGRGPAIQPDDRGAERLGVRVDGDEAIDLGGEPEHPDVLGLDPGTGPQLADHRREGAAPVERVLLGPAGVGVLDRVAGGGLRHDAPAGSSKMPFRLCDPTSHPIAYIRGPTPKSSVV